MAHSSEFLLLLAILLASPYYAFSVDPTNTTGAGVNGSSTDDANASAKTSSLSISQFLAGHNAARLAVRVPALKWDSKLADYASGYALQRKRDCELVHSPGYDYGENIFWGQGRRWTATAITASWVAEKQWYHYKTNTCSGPDCSHYTQIVWRTTESVGCAITVCNSGDTFAVCEYYPPGNYIGARPYY